MAAPRVAHALNALVPLRRLALGQQEVTRAGHVVVVDAHDRPVAGASVSVEWQTAAEFIQGPKGETNGAGILEFSAPRQGSVTAARVTARKDEYYSGRSVVPVWDLEDPGVLVKIPVCLGQPLMTGIEIGAIVVGLGLTFGGMYMKQKPAELIGEVLFGAAAFTIIYRLSCP